MTMTHEQLTLDGSPPPAPAPPSRQQCPTCHGTGDVPHDLYVALTGAIPSAGARATDPTTSHASGRRVHSDDLGRFSQKSRQGKLLRIFASHPMTDYEATAQVLAGIDYSISSFEGTRRRCSDLRRAGLIHDTGLRRRNEGSPDEAVVWAVTGRGMIALANLRESGWSQR